MGSYGENRWVHRTIRNSQGQEVGWPSKDKQWSTINVKQQDQIPMFCDSWWYGAQPENEDIPEVVEGGMNHPNANYTNRFCINRHDQAINICYFDNSVRRVYLKALWRQRWHRNFKMDYPLPVWPEWMKHMRGDPDKK